MPVKKAAQVGGLREGCSCPLRSGRSSLALIWWADFTSEPVWTSSAELSRTTFAEAHVETEACAEEVLGGAEGPDREGRRSSGVGEASR
jgi:hypothetical protein